MTDKTRYAICYLSGRVRDTLEEPRPIKDILKDIEDGGYTHDDYYCSWYENEDTAYDDYFDYINYDEIDGIVAHEYCAVRMLDEDDLL